MKGIRDSLEIILVQAGYKVDLANNGAEGLQKAQSGDYDIIITDILMPEKDGIEMVIQLRDKGLDKPILAISGGGDGVSAAQALDMTRQYASEIMEKPFSKEQLLDKVKQLTD